VENSPTTRERIVRMKWSQFQQLRAAADCYDIDIDLPADMVTLRDNNYTNAYVTVTLERNQSMHHFERLLMDKMIRDGIVCLANDMEAYAASAQHFVEIEQENAGKVSKAAEQLAIASAALQPNDTNERLQDRIRFGEATADDKHFQHKLSLMHTYNVPAAGITQEFVKQYGQPKIQAQYKQYMAFLPPVPTIDASTTTTTATITAASGATMPTTATTTSAAATTTASVAGGNDPQPSSSAVDGLGMAVQAIHEAIEVNGELPLNVVSRIEKPKLIHDLLIALDFVAPPAPAPSPSHPSSAARSIPDIRSRRLVCLDGQTLLDEYATQPASSSILGRLQRLEPYQTELFNHPVAHGLKESDPTELRRQVVNLTQQLLRKHVGITLKPTREYKGTRNRVNKTGKKRRRLAAAPADINDGTGSSQLPWMYELSTAFWDKVEDARSTAL